MFDTFKKRSLLSVPPEFDREIEWDIHSEDQPKHPYINMPQYNHDYLATEYQNDDHAFDLKENFKEHDNENDDEIEPVILSNKVSIQSF